MHLGSMSGGRRLYSAEAMRVCKAFIIFTRGAVVASLEMACRRPSCRAMTRCPRVVDRVVKPLHYTFVSATRMHMQVSMSGVGRVKRPLCAAIVNGLLLGYSMQ